MSQVGDGTFEFEGANMGIVRRNLNGAMRDGGSAKEESVEKHVTTADVVKAVRLLPEVESGMALLTWEKAMGTS